MHGARSVPTEPLRGKNKTLGPRKADLLFQWKDRVALFLDEISMISLELIGRSEFRARQVKSDDGELWGGLTVIGSGDLDQLPPVQSTTCADPLQRPREESAAKQLEWETENVEALAGRRVWEGFSSCVFLEHSRRCPESCATFCKR